MFCSALARGEALEVITLKYKRAEEVIPVVQPFISRGGAVSGMGNQLILRTGNMREIRKIVDSIDRAPRNLKVGVFQGENISALSGGVGISGGRIHAKVYSTDSAGSGENVSYVQVLEGSPAFIKMGKIVQDNTVFFGPYGSGVSAQYREASRGFYVLAHLNGETVTLDASPVMDRLDDGGIELQRLSTRISGRLGEWIELGGMEDRRESSSSEIASASVHTRGESRKIWIRVDLP